VFAVSLWLRKLFLYKFFNFLLPLLQGNQQEASETSRSGVSIYKLYAENICYAI